VRQVLLVDDDELFGDLIEKALIIFGYGVARARDGTAAGRESHRHNRRWE
jgi:DNA-binding response OmpR family regulator